MSVITLCARMRKIARSNTCPYDKTAVVFPALHKNTHEIRNIFSQGYKCISNRGALCLAVILFLERIIVAQTQLNSWTAGVSIYKVQAHLS